MEGIFTNWLLLILPGESPSNRNRIVTGEAGSKSIRSVKIRGSSVFHPGKNPKHG